jgi:hypothetical protein
LQLGQIRCEDRKKVGESRGKLGAIR